MRKRATRVSPVLARRIDRLASHAHAFHRFAHHPLCGRYAGELVSLGGRRRVCRGCLSVLAGTAVGVVVGAFVNVSGAVCVVSAVLGCALLGSSLVVRLPKWLGRALPALLLAAALVAALRSPSWLRVAALVGLPLGALLARALYRARGPYRGTCATCPERNLGSRCSGIAPIVRRERAFQRLAQRWLDAARA
ncbi:MAG: hypothetical protein QM756_04185 [Polyangiaceae bacterium]